MKNTFHTIKTITSQIIGILPLKQKQRLILLPLVMFLEAGFEVLGIALVYPFINLMADQNAYVGNVYLGWIYNIGLTSHFGYVLLIGVLVILIFFLKNAIAILCSYFRISFAKDFKIDTSTKMLRSYLEQGYEFFLNTNSAKIQRNLTEDVHQVHDIIIRLLEITAALITSVTLGVYLETLDPFIATGELLIISLCFFILTTVIKKKAKVAGKTFRKAYSELIQWNNHITGGIKEIMILGRKEKAIDQFRECAKTEGKASLVDSFFQTCPDRIVEGVAMGGFIGIVCLRLSLGATIETIVPIMASFALAAFKIFGNVSKISSRINMIIYRRTALNECYEAIKKLDEQKCARTNTVCKYEKTRKEIHFSDSLSVNGVAWRYQGIDKYILNHISFKIRKGESVAFVGTSGAGKTTLANIILGLLKPEQGKVSIDGVNIFEEDVSLRGVMGHVPQSVFLMDDTIKRNVAFMLRDEEISEEKVWKAIEKAQLADFVRSLPDGIDTMVGERGIKFSGGQSQRISIARALYDDPDILILDEATANLDNDTEAALMDAINGLKGMKTLIIIAHRLSTIQNCDKVYEIVNGAIIQKK